MSTFIVFIIAMFAVPKNSLKHEINRFIHANIIMLVNAINPLSNVSSFDIIKMNNKSPKRRKIMADNRSKEIRSYNMSRIKNKDTKPEILVRRFLFSKGLRYRKNDRRYPGTPDIVLPKYRTVIFVHGCFWHLHPNCKYAVMPSSNVDFWEKKLYDNRSRDRRNQEKLMDQGWRVIVVWECQLKKDLCEQTLDNLYRSIINQQNKTD